MRKGEVKCIKKNCPIGYELTKIVTAVRTHPMVSYVQPSELKWSWRWSCDCPTVTSVVSSADNDKDANDGDKSQNEQKRWVVVDSSLYRLHRDMRTTNMRYLYTYNYMAVRSFLTHIPLPLPLLYSNFSYQQKNPWLRNWTTSHN